MKIRVAVPPSKPLMIYDGECRFCCRWIETWKALTGGKVDYSESQDTSITSLYSEIPLENYDRAVQLIDVDGTVYSGAEAVFRSLSYSPDKKWLLPLYLKVPIFAKLSEATYRFIATNRQFFSKLTRWFLPPQPSEFFLLRSLFLRGLGVIYFFAFFSLATQIIGLSGERGIVPAQMIIQEAGEQLQGNAFSKWLQLPTFSWWSSSDTSLKVQSWLGVLLSLALVVGVVPTFSLLMLWLLYLSLGNTCDPFLSFQWDNLLLETGLLAVFLAPIPWTVDSKERPSVIVIWLFRWLIFRLMFESGLAKVMSGDPTWRDLTALVYHNETQPIPTLLAWYAHHLPIWFHKFGVVITYIVELILPFLVFAPWRFRWIAFAGFVLLQVGIILTGNYAFFNFLTILLSFSLLDDQMVRKLFRWKKRSLIGDDATSAFQPSRYWFPLRTFKTAIFLLVVLIIMLCTMLQLGSFAGFRNWPNPVVKFYSWIHPFRSINAYGLFAVMTTNRPEIIVEGSMDGVEWRPYEFKYKVGDTQERPGFVAPHQPRLDWQMWFASLSDYRNNPWFLNFCYRLLQGQPTVLRLLENNPFPGNPPRFVRARLYQYQFTTPAEKNATAGWWKRGLQGDYLPIVSLESFER